MVSKVFKKTSKVFEGIVSAPKKCIFQFGDISISKPNFLLQLSKHVVLIKIMHTVAYSASFPKISSNLIESMTFIDFSKP